MDIKRRDFIRISGAFGAGLVLNFQMSCATKEEIPVTYQSINAFLKIGTDNSVSIISKNPEIGQGVKTSLPMIIAEELDVSWSQVKVVHAGYQTDLGGQGAGGSTSIKRNWNSLRQVGASARHMLVQAAAEQWQVDPSTCRTSEGKIFHDDSNRSVTYGEVAEQAASYEVPEEVPLKSPSEFKILGQSITTVDIDEIVTGTAQFGIDARPENAYVAVVSKSPVFGGTVKSFDDTDCRTLDGFVEVIEIPADDNPTTCKNGLAIVAKDTWTAMKAKKLLKVEWEESSDLHQSTEDLANQMLTNINKKGDLELKNDGNVNRAFQQAEQVIESTYRVPFLAHAAMEPHNYTAWVTEDKVDCWGPTQVPGLMYRVFVEKYTDLTMDQATVHQQRNGGGFGRRLLGDNAAEAMFLATKLDGPVQVLWTREDDFSHDYYRPMGAYRLKAGLDAEGQLQAWHLNASTTSRYLYRGSDSSPHGTEVFPDGFPAGFVPNFKMEYSPIRTAISTGAWRAPGHNAICFVEQCFLDEVATAGNHDPIAFRLALIGDENKDMPYDDHGGPTYSTQRLRTVIERVRDLSNWDNRNEQNRRLGFAAQFMFGAYVGQVIEVSAKGNSGDFSIDKVYVSVDCGIVINDSGARAQIQGGIVDGLSAALYGEVRIDKGKAVDRNFDSYRMLRMSECPEIEVDLVDSQESPEGLGEISLPTAAPALANALFQLNGERVRTLPVKKYEENFG